MVGGAEPEELDLEEGGEAYPQDIIDCILDGTPALLTQEDGLRNTEVVLRAQESAHANGPVPV